LTATVLACLCIAAIPWGPFNVIQAVVFLAVMFGLRGGHAWGGYGGALYLSAMWVSAAVAVVRFGAPDTERTAVGMVGLVAAGIAYLFFRAGQALAGNGWSALKWGWIAVAAAAFLFPQVFKGYVMPTGSMEDTLLIGDFLLVRAQGTPALSRGDVIIFRYPVDLRQTFVKRCMGLPGDRIKIENKQFYLNGKKLDEPYAYHKTAYVDAYRDNFPNEPNGNITGGGADMLEHHVMNGEVVVPADNYFAIGDNRDASLDSRYWGFVPRANLIGTAWIVYWSYAAPTQSLSSLGGIDQIIGRYRGFFTATRWGRLGMPIHGYPVN
jgi:signal peptidase I